MSATHKTYQLRCYVRKGGHAQLDEVRRMLNTLYNAAFQERWDACRMVGESISLYDQNAALTSTRGNGRSGRRWTSTWPAVCCGD